MASQYVAPNFNIGDQVSVNLELDVFQALQGGHSRWKPEMAKCMGRVGNVLGIGPGYVEVSAWYSSDCDYTKFHIWHFMHSVVCWWHKVAYMAQNPGDTFVTNLPRI